MAHVVISLLNKLHMVQKKASSRDYRWRTCRVSLCKPFVDKGALKAADSSDNIYLSFKNPSKCNTTYYRKLPSKPKYVSISFYIVTEVILQCNSVVDVWKNELFGKCGNIGHINIHWDCSKFRVMRRNESFAAEQSQKQCLPWPSVIKVHTK